MPKQKKTKKPSWAAARRAFAEQTEGTGITYAGRWPDDVENRLQQSFSTQQTRQILRHISIQVFMYVRKQLGRTGEQEVQSMLVNGRVLVATNDGESIDMLVAALKKKAKAKGQENGLRDILTGRWSTEKRAVRAGKKLKRVIAGTRAKTVPVAKIVRAIPEKTEDCFEVMDLSGNDARLVTSVGGARKIIFVKGSPAPHAEQKLVHALVQSGHTGEAHVYGKKRPCFGCYLTLKYVKEHGFPNLIFNPNPGGTWYPPMKEFADHAALFGSDRESVLEWFLEQAEDAYTAYKSGAGGATDYDTESDSEAED